MLTWVDMGIKWNNAVASCTTEVVIWQTALCIIKRCLIQFYVNQKYLQHDLLSNLDLVSIQNRCELFSPLWSIHLAQPHPLPLSYLTHGRIFIVTFEPLVAPYFPIIFQQRPPNLNYYYSTGCWWGHTWNIVHRLVPLPRKDIVELESVPRRSWINFWDDPSKRRWWIYILCSLEEREVALLKHTSFLKGAG